jgi:serine/threonine protein kinase
MEFAESGDLKSVINKQIMNNYEKINEETIWDWAFQIASALKYLHSKKIIHRDIKSENVFITADKNSKLGDFGISKILDNTLEFAKSGVGTPYYLSPEICKGDSYNFKTDIWMFGCLLYELSTLEKPFKANSINSLIDKIVNTDPAKIEYNYSNELKDMIFIMLKKHPEDRPGIDEILTIIQKQSKIYHIPTNKVPFIPKMIDKNKLKIEIDLESLENSPQVSQKKAPSSHLNIPSGLKLNSKMFADGYSKQKYTPSSHKKDINKIMKKMKISPMNNPIPVQWETEEEKFDKSTRKTTCTSAISTPTNVKEDNCTTGKSDENNSSFSKNSGNTTHKPEVNLKRGHFRHISLNISSIQSSDHEAVYRIDNIEKIENIEFLYPSNITDNSKRNKLTPTNSLDVDSKIYPKKSVMRNAKEIPKSTKVHFEQDTNLIRKTLIRNFLIERYGKEKFSVMYNSILENNKVINPNMIKSLAGDDYKIAMNYLGYLINSSKKKYE